MGVLRCSRDYLLQPEPTDHAEVDRGSDRSRAAADAFKQRRTAQSLQRHYESLNPFQLRKRIEELQRQLHSPVFRNCETES